jgi:hypothetical protein
MYLFGQPKSQLHEASDMNEDWNERLFTRWPIVVLIESTLLSSCLIY